MSKSKDVSSFGVSSQDHEIVIADGENEYIATYDEIRDEWFCQIAGPDIGAGDIGCVETREEAWQLIAWEADIVSERPDGVYHFEYEA